MRGTLHLKTEKSSIKVGLDPLSSLVIETRTEGRGRGESNPHSPLYPPSLQSMRREKNSPRTPPSLMPQPQTRTSEEGEVRFLKEKGESHLSSVLYLSHHKFGHWRGKGERETHPSLIFSSLNKGIRGGKESYISGSSPISNALEVELPHLRHSK